MTSTRTGASSGAPTPARTADALSSGLRRTEVQHRSSSIPGRDIVQVRTEIPDGVASGWHTHPGEEVGYIVEGTVRMEVAGGQPLLLQAGDGFLIPPRTPHNAHDLGPGTGVMLSTYLVDPEAPLSTFVDAPSEAAGAGKDAG
jgi:quercetin dioxygenase-like cupin family protein